MHTHVEDAARPAAGERSEFHPTTFTRPDRALLTYYFIVALFSNVAFPFVILPLVCRYITLRYRFDDEGISVSWGVLFHKEVQLTYRRIQDIHVKSNVVQRWLGLATVEVQTASGSSSAEVAIEGIKEPEKLRDFLYSKMRGAVDGPPVAVAGEDVDGSPERIGDEALVLLREIRQAVERLADSTCRTTRSPDDGGITG